MAVPLDSSASLTFLFSFSLPGGFRVKHVGKEWKYSSALSDTGVMDIRFSWKLLIRMINSA